jgi:hypothetical protein
VKFVAGGKILTEKSLEQARLEDSNDAFDGEAELLVLGTDQPRVVVLEQLESTMGL